MMEMKRRAALHLVTVGGMAGLLGTATSPASGTPTDSGKSSDSALVRMLPPGDFRNEYADVNGTRPHCMVGGRGKPLLLLALRVAAELAASHADTPLAELVLDLDDRHRRLQLLQTGADTRTTVRTVFSWSYGHLPLDAARLFRRLG